MYLVHRRHTHSAFFAQISNYTRSWKSRSKSRNSRSFRRNKDSVSSSQGAPLSRPKEIYRIPYILRSILILSSQIRPSLESESFLPTFLTEIFCTVLITAHPSLPYLTYLIIFNEYYKFWKSSLCCFPHYTVISSSLGANTFFFYSEATFFGQC